MLKLIKKRHFVLIGLVMAGFFLSSLTYEASGQLYRQRKGGYFYNDPNLRKPKPLDVNPFFEEKAYIHTNGDTLQYRILIPQNYDPRIAYPLVLFLHGAGERGADNQSQLVHGARLFVEKRQDYPAIVVFPQCPANSFWSNVEMKTEQVDDTTTKYVFDFPVDAPPTRSMEMLLGLLPAIEQQYKIKPEQRYVMGLSMGGMGTFELVQRKPDYFAGAVPICGGANPAIASDIRNTAFWVFHGQLDDVVPYSLSENMVLALQALYAKEEVAFTFYPQANHNSWDAAFAEPDLLSWLFKQKRVF